MALSMTTTMSSLHACILCGRNASIALTSPKKITPNKGRLSRQVFVRGSDKVHFWGDQGTTLALSAASLGFQRGWNAYGPFAVGSASRRPASAALPTQPQRTGWTHQATVASIEPFRTPSSAVGQKGTIPKRSS